LPGLIWQSIDLQTSFCKDDGCASLTRFCPRMTDPRTVAVGLHRPQ
jgi:hypothetical protein